MKKNLDKFRGCLIGGAAGDALGYPIEHLTENFLFATFGEKGITEYRPLKGMARISDDTQMTMFTANGLLFGTTRGCTRGIMGTYPSYVAHSYRDWYKTQFESYEHCNRKFITSWLMNVPEMFADRGPGRTCLTSIDAGCYGTIENPINDGKAKGGVMRVAPIGLYFGDSRMAPLAFDLMGADVAALTHGHEMGYIPAAMLVHIVRLVSHNDEVTLKDAVLDSKVAMKMLFPDAKNLTGFLKLIDKAVELSESDLANLDAIHKLGKGWLGDEALAIALYTVLAHPDDIAAALRAAVNHKGDSDSTGAVAGNILGALVGRAALEETFDLAALEEPELIVKVADGLLGYTSKEA
jgi:ADP-ribosylglycohydrolase